jgi:hypothetical protein
MFLNDEEIAKIRLKIAGLSERLCYQTEEPEIKEKVLVELEKVCDEYIQIRRRS